MLGIKLKKDESFFYLTGRISVATAARRRRRILRTGFLFGWKVRPVNEPMPVRQSMAAKRPDLA